MPDLTPVLKSRYSQKLRAAAVLLAASFLFQDLAWAAPEIRLALSAAPMPAFPASVATVENHFSGLPALPTVYLLRDAHVNESAQRNIAAILEKLAGKHGTDLVFLEGGWGDLSLSKLAQGVPAKQRQKAAESFLKKGWIQGPDFADLVSENPIRLIGAEDKALYQKGVELYRETVEKRERALAWLDLAGRLHGFLKSRLYSPDLQTLDEKRSAYRKDNQSFFEYLEALTAASARTGIRLDGFEAVRRAAALRARESQIDFAAASREQIAVLQALDPADREALAALAREKKRTPDFYGASGHEADGGFFALLAEKIGPRNAQYPHLSAYLDYLREARKIRFEELLGQTEALETAVFFSLARTDDERQLIFSERILEILRGLFTLKLESAQWELLKNQSAAFDPQNLAAYLNSKIMDLGTRHEFVLFWEKEVGDAYVTARAFYQNAEERDGAMAENLFSEIRNRQSAIRSVSLVAGGFHTDHLEELFKKRGVPFVSIRPQVYSETNAKKYEGLLLNTSTIAVLPGALMKTPQGPVTALLAQAFAGARLSTPESEKRLLDAIEFFRTHPESLLSVKEVAVQSGHSEPYIYLAVRKFAAVQNALDDVIVERIVRAIWVLRGRGAKEFRDGQIAELARLNSKIIKRYRDFEKVDRALKGKKPPQAEPERVPAETVLPPRVSGLLESETLERSVLAYARMNHASSFEVSLNGLWAPISAHEEIVLGAAGLSDDEQKTVEGFNSVIFAIGRKTSRARQYLEGKFSDPLEFQNAAEWFARGEAAVDGMQALLEEHFPGEIDPAQPMQSGVYNVSNLAAYLREMRVMMTHSRALVEGRPVEGSSDLRRVLERIQKQYPKKTQGGGSLTLDLDVRAVFEEDYVLPFTPFDAFSIFNNLISNSVKHNEENHKYQTAVRIRIEKAGGFRRIKVLDDAGGIPENLLSVDTASGLPSLLRLGLSTSERTEGHSGVGLSEVSYLARDHDMNLDVSNHGRPHAMAASAGTASIRETTSTNGAEFTLRFVLHLAKPADAALPAAASPAGSRLSITKDGRSVNNKYLGRRMSALELLAVIGVDHQHFRTLQLTPARAGDTRHGAITLTPKSRLQNIQIDPGIYNIAVETKPAQKIPAPKDLTERGMPSGSALINRVAQLAEQDKYKEAVALMIANPVSRNVFRQLMSDMDLVALSAAYRNFHLYPALLAGAQRNLVRLTERLVMRARARLGAANPEAEMPFNARLAALSGSAARIVRKIGEDRGTSFEVGEEIWNEFIRRGWRADGRTLDAQVEAAILEFFEVSLRNKKFGKGDPLGLRSIHGKASRESVEKLMAVVREAIKEIKQTAGHMDARKLSSIARRSIAAETAERIRGETTELQGKEEKRTARANTDADRIRLRAQGIALGKKWLAAGFIPTPTWLKTFQPDFYEDYFNGEPAAFRNPYDFMDAIDVPPGLVERSRSAVMRKNEFESLVGMKRVEDLRYRRVMQSSPDVYLTALNRYGSWKAAALAVVGGYARQADLGPDMTDEALRYVRRAQTSEKAGARLASESDGAEAARIIKELHVRGVVPQLNGVQLIDLSPKDLLDHVERFSVLKDSHAVLEILRARLRAAGAAGEETTVLPQEQALRLYDALFDQSRFIGSNFSERRPMKIAVLRGGSGVASLIRDLKALGPAVSIQNVLGATDDGRSWFHAAKDFNATGIPDAGKALLDMAQDKAAVDFLKARLKGNREELLRDFSAFLKKWENPDAPLPETFRPVYEKALKLDAAKSARLRGYLLVFEKELREKYSDSHFSLNQVPLRSLVLLGAAWSFGDSPDRWQNAVDEVGGILGMAPEDSVVFLTQERPHLVAMTADGTIYFTETGINELPKRAPYLGLWLTKEKIDPARFKEELAKKGVLLQQGVVDEDDISQRPEILSDSAMRLEIERSTGKVPADRAREVAEWISHESSTGAFSGDKTQVTSEGRAALAQADAIVYGTTTMESNMGSAVLVPGVNETIRDNQSAVKILLANPIRETDTPGTKAFHLLSRLYRYLTRRLSYVEPNLDFTGIEQSIEYVLGISPQYPGLDREKEYIPFDASTITAVTNGAVGAIGMDMEMKTPIPLAPKVYGEPRLGFGVYDSLVERESILALAGIKRAGFRVTSKGSLEPIHPSAGARLAAMPRRNFNRFLFTGLAGIAVGALSEYANVSAVLRQAREEEHTGNFPAAAWTIKIVPYDRKTQDGLERGALSFISTLNPFTRNLQGKKPIGWLVIDGQEVNPFNPNRGGFAQQRAIAFAGGDGRLRIAASGKKKTNETVAYAFQSGPLAVSEGTTNEGIFQWYQGWRHGKAMALGTDEAGTVYRKTFLGYDVFGLTGESTEDFRSEFTDWKERHGIREALFVDGGIIGLRGWNVKPTHVLVAEKKKTPSLSNSPQNASFGVPYSGAQRGARLSAPAVMAAAAMHRLLQAENEDALLRTFETAVESPEGEKTLLMALESLAAVRADALERIKQLLLRTRKELAEADWIDRAERILFTAYLNTASEAHLKKTLTDGVRRAIMERKSKGPAFTSFEDVLDAVVHSGSGARPSGNVMSNSLLQNLRNKTLNLPPAAPAAAEISKAEPSPAARSAESGGELNPLPPARDPIFGEEGRPLNLEAVEEFHKNENGKSVWDIPALIRQRERMKRRLADEFADWEARWTSLVDADFFEAVEAFAQYLDEKILPRYILDEKRQLPEDQRAYQQFLTDTRLLSGLLEALPPAKEYDRLKADALDAIQSKVRPDNGQAKWLRDLQESAERYRRDPSEINRRRFAARILYWLVWDESGLLSGDFFKQSGFESPEHFLRYADDPQWDWNRFASVLETYKAAASPAPEFLNTDEAFQKAAKYEESKRAADPSFSWLASAKHLAGFLRELYFWIHLKEEGIKKYFDKDTGFLRMTQSVRLNESIVPPEEWTNRAVGPEDKIKIVPAGNYWVTILEGLMPRPETRGRKDAGTLALETFTLSSGKSAVKEPDVLKALTEAGIRPAENFEGRPYYDDPDGNLAARVALSRVIPAKKRGMIDSKRLARLVNARLHRLDRVSKARMLEIINDRNLIAAAQERLGPGRPALLKESGRRFYYDPVLADVIVPHFDSPHSKGYRTAKESLEELNRLQRRAKKPVFGSVAAFLNFAGEFGVNEDPDQLKWQGLYFFGPAVPQKIADGLRKREEEKKVLPSGRISSDELTRLVNARLPKNHKTDRLLVMYAVQQHGLVARAQERLGKETPATEVFKSRTYYHPVLADIVIPYFDSPEYHGYRSSEKTLQVLNGLLTRKGLRTYTSTASLKKQAQEYGMGQEPFFREWNGWHYYEKSVPGRIMKGIAASPARTDRSPEGRIGIDTLTRRVNARLHRQDRVQPATVRYAVTANGLTAAAEERMGPGHAATEVLKDKTYYDPVFVDLLVPLFDSPRSRGYSDVRKSLATLNRLLRQAGRKTFETPETFTKLAVEYGATGEDLRVFWGNRFFYAPQVPDLIFRKLEENISGLITINAAWVQVNRGVRPSFRISRSKLEAYARRLKNAGEISHYREPRENYYSDTLVQKARDRYLPKNAERLLSEKQFLIEMNRSAGPSEKIAFKTLRDAGSPLKNLFLPDYRRNDGVWFYDRSRAAEGRLVLGARLAQIPIWPRKGFSLISVPRRVEGEFSKKELQENLTNLKWIYQALLNANGEYPTNGIPQALAKVGPTVDMQNIQQLKQLAWFHADPSRWAEALPIFFHENLWPTDLRYSVWTATYTDRSIDHPSLGKIFLITSSPSPVYAGHAAAEEEIPVTSGARLAQETEAPEEEQPLKAKLPSSIHIPRAFFKEDSVKELSAPGEMGLAWSTIWMPLFAIPVTFLFPFAHVPLWFYGVLYVVGLKPVVSGFLLWELSKQYKKRVSIPKIVEAYLSSQMKEGAENQSGEFQRLWYFRTRLKARAFAFDWRGGLRVYFDEPRWLRWLAPFVYPLPQWIEPLDDWRPHTKTVKAGAAKKVAALRPAPEPGSGARLAEAFQDISGGIHAFRGANVAAPDEVDQMIQAEIDAGREVWLRLRVNDPEKVQEVHRSGLKTSSGFVSTWFYEDIRSLIPVGRYAASFLEWKKQNRVVKAALDMGYPLPIVTVEDIDKVSGFALVSFSKEDNESTLIPIKDEYSWNRRPRLESQRKEITERLEGYGYLIPLTMIDRLFVPGARLAVGKFKTPLERSLVIFNEMVAVQKAAKEPVRFDNSRSNEWGMDKDDLLRTFRAMKYAGILRVPAGYARDIVFEFEPAFLDALRSKERRDVFVEDIRTVIRSAQKYSALPNALLRYVRYGTLPSESAAPAVSADPEIPEAPQKTAELAAPAKGSFMPPLKQTYAFLISRPNPRSLISRGEIMAGLQRSNESAQRSLDNLAAARVIQKTQGGYEWAGWIGRNLDNDSVRRRLSRVFAREDIYTLASFSTAIETVRALSSLALPPAVIKKPSSEQGARLAPFLEALSRTFRDLTDQSLPLKVENRRYLFTFTRGNDGTLVARAEGMKDIAIEAKKEPLGESAFGNGPSVSEIRSVSGILTGRVHALLDAAGIEENKRVVLKINADILPSDSFDLYADALLAALKQAAHRRYGRNVLFAAAGERAERLLDLEPASELFTRSIPAGWADAGEVLVDLPRPFEWTGVRVPIQALAEGDIPAFEALLRLAIEAGRIDASSVPDAFEEAYGLLAGSRPGKPVLSGILNGTAPLPVVRQFALKALQAAPISQVIQFFRMLKRQFEQSA